MQYQQIKRIRTTLLFLILSLLVGLGVVSPSLAQEPAGVNPDTLRANHAALPLTNFSQQAKLTADEDFFGYSVAIKDDLAVIGAPGRAAYIFEKPANGGWAKATETAKLTAANGHLEDRFSFSLVIDTDTILVGAPRYKNFTEGAVYIYEKAADGWADMTETGKLIIADDQGLDHYFGYSMAISGNTLFVTALGELNDGTGAVYIFEKPAAGSWTNAKQIARLVSSDSEAGDQFGSAIAISGDTLVIGAASKEGGAVYIFEKPAAGSWAYVSEITKLIASDSQSPGFYLNSVAINAKAIVIGASIKGNKDAVYLFEKPADGWANTAGVETAKLTPADSQDYDNFGNSVAIIDNNIFISASNFKDADGAVYVFEGSNQIDQLPIATSPNNRSIVVNNDTVLIGASHVNGGRLHL